MRERRGSEWARRYLKEIERKSETGEGKSRWKRERRLYIEERGVRLREVNKKEGNDEVWGKIEWKKKRRQKEERDRNDKRGKVL